MTDHALVVGASVAGLAAAAALAPAFRRVTVVDRRVPQPGASIARHGRYPHVMLQGGSTALETLVPGFGAALRAAGAPEVDRDRVRWWADGWRARRASVASPRVLATRALIESTLRARVEALPNVEVRYGEEIEMLALANRRVIGADDHRCELVVDASGRSARSLHWLAQAGLPSPPISELEVDLGYAMIELRRRPEDLGGTLACVVQNLAPELTRLGLAIAVEGDRWMVLLGGYFGDVPDDPLAFARSLPVPEIAELLASCEPIGEPLPYRFKSSRRIHFERAALPAGLVVLGDAMCSFNPLYGQGMSVAAMQAAHLGRALGRRHLQRDLAAITDRAWMIAAGGDLAYPQVAGTRTRFGRWMSGHMRRVFRACTVDGSLVDTLWDVTNLVAPASKLLTPAALWRVWRGQPRHTRPQLTAAAEQ